MYNRRYVCDPLYGVIRLPDYVWEVLTCPELQRLREVRLCNVNSLSLTGGANINRYEHSIGAAYLALECTQGWETISDEDTRAVVLAALLHDVAGAAFGHSVQYVLELTGYRHEALEHVLLCCGSGDSGAADARTEPVFFGLMRQLSQRIPNGLRKAICEIVAGAHPLGPLVNGPLDLDNIDNVFRLAYHVGLVDRSETPLTLARSIRISEARLVVQDQAVDCIRHWYEVRKRLYRYLLLNADEFSAKCMLEEALTLARAGSEYVLLWTDVDYQLLDKLNGCSDEVSRIVKRIMTGDLYGCIAIFAAPGISLYDIVCNPQLRTELERSLEAHVRKRVPTLSTSSIALHAIRDVNKTQRVIEVLTASGGLVSVGSRLDRVLVGVFDRDARMSAMRIDEMLVAESGVREVIRDWFAQELDQEVSEIVPYAEAYEQ